MNENVKNYAEMLIQLFMWEMYKIVDEYSDDKIPRDECKLAFELDAKILRTIEEFIEEKENE